MTRIDLVFGAEGVTRDVERRVYEARARQANGEPRRGYLGMSAIGEPCGRKLWLDFHGHARRPIEGRLARVFDMGHAVEARVIADLRLAGLEVDGEQLTFSDFDGRFMGHCDGIVHNVTKKPHILEIKSANDASFANFESKGVKASNPKYYAQLQCYMGYADLARALFVVENKNDQRLYFERVKFDPIFFEALRTKAWNILIGDAPPAKVDDYVTCHYFCDFRDACEEVSL